jgi:hypothetical protein
MQVSLQAFTEKLQTKRCTKCGQLKSTAEFEKRSDCASGWRRVCIGCRREVNNQWERTHRIKRRPREKTYYLKHTAEILSRKRVYYHLHPKYYWAMSAISNHQKAGHHVLLTGKELAKLAETVSNCPICGCVLKYGGHKSRETASLDRKDNSPKVDSEGTWIICMRCNTTKGDRSFPEFVRYCQQVSEKFWRSL